MGAKAFGGHDVLLVFQKGATSETVHIPGGGVSPVQGGDGTLHVAFAIGKDQLAAWEERLAAKGVTIEGAHTWTRGGRSIYFRDPDGHLLELATPGLWTVY